MAVDATCLTQKAVIPFIVLRMRHHREKPLTWRHWLKRGVMADPELHTERNHTYIGQQLGAQSVIPASRG